MKIRCRCKHEMRVPNDRYGETIACGQCGRPIHLVRRNDGAGNAPGNTTHSDASTVQNETSTSGGAASPAGTSASNPAGVPGDTTALDLSRTDTDDFAFEMKPQETPDMPPPAPQPDPQRLATLQKDLQRLLDEKGTLESRLRETEHRHEIWTRETRESHQKAQRRLQEQLQQALDAQESLEDELVQARTHNQLNDESAAAWKEKLQNAEAECESLRAAIAYQREQYAARLDDMQREAEREIGSLREALEVETTLSREKADAERARHASYMETMRQEMTRLESELVDARATAEQATRDADLAQHNLEQVLLSTGNKEEEFREGLEASHAEVTSALAALAEARGRVRELEETLAREREGFLIQEKELAAIAEQHRHRAEADRKERDRYEEMLISTRHENANLHVEADKVKATLETMQVELAKREQDRFEAEHRRKEADDALAASRAEIESLEDALARGKIEADRIAARLRDEADAVRKEKTDLQARLIALRQETEGLRKTAASLEDSLRTERAEHELRESRLGTELTETQRSLKDTATRLEAALQRNADMEAAHAEDRARFDTQTTRLRQDLKDLGKRAEHDHREMTRFQTMIVEARHEHDALSMQLDKARQALDEQAQANRGDRAGLLGEIRVLEKRLQDQTDRVQTLEKELDIQHKLAANQLEQLRAQHRQQLATLETNASRNQEKANQFAEEAETLRRRCETLDQLLEASRERNLELESTLRVDLQQSLDAHAAAQTRLLHVEESLRRETERGKRLEGQLLRERESFLRREQGLLGKLAHQDESRLADQEEMLRLSSVMETLQQELLQFQTERDDLEAQAIRMQEEAQATSAKARMLERALEETREASEAGVASKEFLKGKVAQLEADLAEATARADEEHGHRAAAEEKLRTGRESILRLERELNRIQVQEDTLREREEEVRSLRNQLQLRTAASREQADALTEERDRLKAETDHLRDALERAHAEREMDSRRLQEENEQLLEASAASKAFLKEKIARLESEVESLRLRQGDAQSVAAEPTTVEAVHAHQA